jgi:uncharacterized membrane protein YccC
MKSKFSQYYLRAIRLGFCISISLLLSHFFNFLHPLWILITIIVVMFDQATVGGTIYRGFLRIIATAFGAAIGAFILLSFNDNVIVNDVVIIAGSMLCGLIFMDSKYSYIGLLGAATFVMVLAPNDGFNSLVIHGINLGLPFTRVISIILGAILAILCIKYFFPQYASNNIDEHITLSLTTIRNLLNILIDDSILAAERKEKMFNFEATLPSIYTKFEKLSHESKFENKNKFNHTQMIKHLNRIYHLVYILDDILCENNKIQDNLKNKINEILNTFDNIIKQYKKNKNVSNLNNINIIDSTLLKVNPNQVFANDILNKIIIETDYLVNFLNTKQQNIVKT